MSALASIDMTACAHCRAASHARCAYLTRGVSCTCTDAACVARRARADEIEKRPARPETATPPPS